MESFFEVMAADDWNWILDLFCLHSNIPFITGESSSLFLCTNRFSDSCLRGSLAKFGDISTSEVLSQISTEVKGNIWCDWTLPEDCLKDL